MAQIPSMKGLLVKFFVPAIIFVIAVVVNIAAAQSSATSGESQQHSRPDFEGEYRGQLLVKGEAKMKAGLKVTAVGDNEYRATLYYGGLPRKQSGSIDRKIELEGTYEDFTLRLEGNIPFKLQYIHGRFTALDEECSYTGHLEPVIRVRPDD